MMFLNENFSDVYKNYLRDKFLVYKHPGKYNCSPESIITYNAHHNSEVFKELIKSKNYKDIINNNTPANLLSDLEIDKNKLFDDYSYSFMGYPYDLKETELQNIKSRKAFLRVNYENNVVYTVNKVKDWYVFKLFFPSRTEFWDGEKSETVLKANLMAVWCVKRLPDTEKFNTIIPGITTMSDVINIDPSFRYFEENGIRYSTHTFADKDGSRISIEYKKDGRGVYRVSNIAKVKEGWNLLPYLLPIDRKLIDPNYDESSTDSEEKAVVSKSNSGNESSICTIV